MNILLVIHNISHKNRFGSSFKNQGHIKQKFTSGRKQIRFINRPEPQRTPIVHCKLQSCIRTGIPHVFTLIEFTEDLVLLANRSMRILCIIGIAKDRESVLCFSAYFLTQLNLRLPQLINCRRESQQSNNLIVSERTGKLLVPVFHLLDVCRLQLLNNFIGIAAHSRIAKQEMINLLFRHTFCSQRYPIRLHLIPTQPFRGGLCVLNAIHLPSCTDQGVSVHQLRAKPRHKAALINGVQPQGNFCQLNSHRVQVDAINIAVSNEHLDLL